MHKIVRKKYAAIVSIVQPIVSIVVKSAVLFNHNGHNGMHNGHNNNGMI